MQEKLENVNCDDSFLILLALDIQIYTKYIHTLNSPRLQPQSLEKTFYATYAYYDGDQRTTYVLCIYSGKCRAFIEMRVT